MPTFTQEELDELAHSDTVEENVSDKEGNREVSLPVVAEVGGGEKKHTDMEVDMKQEDEEDMQEVPSEGTQDEEFQEALQDHTGHADELDAIEVADTALDEKAPDADIVMRDLDSESGEHEHQSDLEAGPVTKRDDEDPSDSDSENRGVNSELENDEKEDEEDEGDDDEGEDETHTEDTESSESDTEDASGSSSEEDEDQAEDESVKSTTCSNCQMALPDEQDDQGLSVIECSKCSAHVHQKCARESGTLDDEEDLTSWRCQNCVRTQLSESPKETRKNKNAAPRLVRDLLPVSRGVQKPNSHSIFNQPLISEGEDGGRALRKRKSPTVEPPVSEKRRRKATPKALSASLPEESKIETVAHVTRRASHKSIPTARILQYRPYEKAPPHKFILAFRLDQNKIEKILNKPSRPGRRRDRRRPPKIPPPPIYQPPVPKFPALPTHHLIFPSMWGDRENEANAKPYGGILSDAEADTTRSLPQLRDRELFEVARKEAEEERRKTSAAAEVEISGENANTTKPNRTVSGPPSKIKCIQFGKHVIDTFYAAPYPEEYSHESRLFICEFCLKYLPSEFVAYRHKLKCPAKHPPGDEIYRDGTISIWEVDGRKKTEYCQCLCLMAKMFLGSKTLYYDVEPFLFYILTEYDELGYHFVGYFSKEKRPASQNNVSCILVMPIHQRKGYATFLIDFSYLLTRIEGKDGSPEKPLSDMGLTAYRSYWDLTISRKLLEIGMKPFSTKDLMQKTGMTADDVVHSLERLYAFVKDPVTKTYAIRYDEKLYRNIIADYESKKHREMRPDNLIWTPYIMGRSDQAHLDTQPVQAIAPREGDDIAVEDSETDSRNGKTQSEMPGSFQNLAGKAPMQAQVPAKDPLLVNGAGHIAPGPPSAQLLTGSAPISQQEAEPHVNGIDESTAGGVDTAELLSGYALAYRDGKIPPNRFQIDPPIPASMLRARSHKKRNTGFSRNNLNGDSAQSPSMAPVRSSPRHAASSNGSVNGGNEATSPEKPSTPMRRSNRKSGLSHMENAGLDGSVDQDDDDEDDDEQEIGDEIEAKADVDDEDEESGSENSSEEQDEEESAEDEGEDEDEEEEDEAEIPEDEEDDDDPDILDLVDESEEDESEDD